MNRISTLAKHHSAKSIEIWRYLIMNCALSIMHYELSIVHYALCITPDCALSIMHYELSIVHYFSYSLYL